MTGYYSATETHAFKALPANKAREQSQRTLSAPAPVAKGSCSSSQGVRTWHSHRRTRTSPPATLQPLPVHICTYIFISWHFPRGYLTPWSPVELKEEYSGSSIPTTLCYIQLADTLKRLALQYRAPCCSDVYLLWGHAF